MIEIEDPGKESTFMPMEDVEGANPAERAEEETGTAQGVDNEQKAHKEGVKDAVVAGEGGGGTGGDTAGGDAGAGTDAGSGGASQGGGSSGDAGGASSGGGTDAGAVGGGEGSGSTGGTTSGN